MSMAWSFPSLVSAPPSSTLTRAMKKREASEEAHDGAGKSGGGVFDEDAAVELNYAIRKVLTAHASELYDHAPALGQFRQKGRIHRHIGTLMGSARGGAEAGRRFDADKKAAAAPDKKSATPSPKKAKLE